MPLKYAPFPPWNRLTADVLLPIAHHRTSCDSTHSFVHIFSLPACDEPRSSRSPAIFQNKFRPFFASFPTSTPPNMTGCVTFDPNNYPHSKPAHLQFPFRVVSFSHATQPTPLRPLCIRPRRIISSRTSIPRCPLSTVHCCPLLFLQKLKDAKNAWHP